MKKVLLLIFCLCSNVAIYAQSKAEKQVGAAVEKLRLAMVEPNSDVLSQLVADKLSYGHSSGKLENKSEFIQALTSKSSDFTTINLTQQTVQVTGKTAIVRHHLAAETNDKGVSGTVKLAIMLVWQKQQGQWRLLARQAVKV